MSQVGLLHSTSILVIVDEYVLRCFANESAPRVKELAQELGQPRWALSRAFECDAGCTLREHMRWRQVEFACALLRETSLSTTVIGYRAGFQTRATFFRVFRALLGCTPSAFRHRTLWSSVHGPVLAAA